MSVDVEDYFHAEALSSASPRESWECITGRIERNMRTVFDVLDQHRTRATMFFLGWVAERYPALVAEAVVRGHEVGCHSYWHRPVFRLSPNQFREDTKRAKDVIEEAAMQSVVGYRAPGFSILQGMNWATDILAELGFLYDSSVNPIRHDLYNNPDAPRTPHQTSSGLMEIPVTTWRVGSTNLPLGGGAYLRVLPFWYMRAGLSRVTTRGTRLVLYLHPWELDPEQPRLDVPLWSRFRHYSGLAGMQRRWQYLLERYRFAPIVEAFADVLPRRRALTA
jgi:polysaccharide deacetylase family protein (PEP-CTERM system associated)